MDWGDLQEEPPKKPEPIHFMRENALTHLNKDWPQIEAKLSNEAQKYIMDECNIQCGKTRKDFTFSKLLFGRRNRF